MSALIRHAEMSDRGPLIALSHRTIRGCYPSFLGAAAVDAFLGSGAADRYVSENLSRCFVVMSEGVIVGYAVHRESTIDLMMIDCAHQRRGIGTALLAHVEALLFATYDTVRLESFEKNAPANAFYRRNGWVQLSRHFDEESGTHKIGFQKRRATA